MGGSVSSDSSDSSDFYTSEGVSLKNRTCSYWTKTKSERYGIVFVDHSGYYHHERPCEDRGISIRPVMNYSSLPSLDICSYKGVNGVEIVEYGEYPQSVIPKEDARKLERLYKKRRWKLNWTAEKYTTDSNLNNNTEVGFITREHHVYEYEGKKYIRLVGDENVEGELLSDGQIVTIGTPYWIKVEPVKWLLDREKDLLISKDALVSGIQFNFKRSYTEKEFDETTIKWYLDNHLSK